MKQINFESKRDIIKIIMVLLFPLQLFSQDLTGVWTGKVYTTEKTLPYEVAISVKDGKLSGYSYTTFNVKGEEMVAMKSIVLTRDKDSNIVIEDEDLVFNSFDEESPKQLKQTNIMQLSINGSTMIMTGKFKTKKTKEFRSLVGSVRLKKDSIIEQPKLIAKLTEMDLAKSLSFLETKTAPNDVAITRVVTEIEKPSEPEKPTANLTIKAPVNSIQPSKIPTIKSAVKTPAPVPSKPVAAVPIPVKKLPVSPTIASVPVTRRPGIATSFASNLGDRTIETIQTVVFKSDSLRLTLYDNGTVDGDTVSVLLNGKMILSKQGLSTNAINKTIYLTPDMGDSMQLIMYAENLGSIPPNTGLLIIKDGRDRYEIRFAGDLKKNAAIILKRKLPE